MLVIKEINEEDQTKLEVGLHDYDYKMTEAIYNKKISFGYYDDHNNLVAGITAKIEGYKIMYIETLFVNECYRHLGIGKTLIKQMEERAIFEGIKLIRLDTFSWQALEFYKKLGYEVATSYEISDNAYEYILIKRI
mgnify:CR=1 FL=1